MTRGGGRLLWIVASFLCVCLATRIGLALFGDGHYSVREWGRFLTIGLLFDLAVLPWLLLPWGIYEAVMPKLSEGRLPDRWERRWALLWAIAYLVFFLVLAAAEFAFWAEFDSRFDFIAVDYLIYTHEVLGNIRESYPVGLWLAAIFGLALAVCWRGWPRHVDEKTWGWRGRWGGVALAAAAALLGLGAINQDLADDDPNFKVRQLSTNGIFALAHAFRNNELDYDRYYPRLKTDEVAAKIRALVRQPNAVFTAAQGIERKVTAVRPPKKVNIVLISVESLSADFLGRFGNTQGLTPELDKLADRGLLFSRLYATGTRTVRGLEALSIGTPPTPGQSIVRRPNNDGLENIGEELAEYGWKPYWIYGGYGFFDNMNAYFAANHYRVVDRAEMDVEKLPIHHENIWGIADEDLFSLAIAKFDKEHAAGNRFFAHVMTTSNHRPYTFPENRIDLPQKHREGAVKYTDWAIGDFIRRSADKPWFDNTLFVITADHTAKASGKTDLPPDRYHIPMIWYAPALIEPGRMDRLMSQIDVAPTVMGWAGLTYTSRFFGYDMFTLERGRERAFISTYQKLGYLKGGRLVVLDVNRKPQVAVGLPLPTGDPAPVSDQQLIDEAIVWYQSASRMFRSGLMREGVDDDDHEPRRP